MTDNSFAALGLAEPLLRALAGAGHVTPTPIQTRAIPTLLEGRDMLGIAQTGTGKTAAFALPILQALAAKPERVQPRTARCLVLAPTRELAAQIAESFRVYGKFLRLSQAVVFGGVGYEPQRRAMHRGIDVLVATPGRLLDHIEQGTIRLDSVTHLVLDEADRMLDMGFVRDVTRIVRLLPKQRHSLLFSATMPKAVAELAASMLIKPVRVEVTPEKVTVDKVEQHVHHIPAQGKRALLARLLTEAGQGRAIVFTRTKRMANRVSEILDEQGFSAAAIHGNKSQGAREKALAGFKAGTCRVLVATDIAARGIDVPGVEMVVNYEMPTEPEAYVHRIGRTARAGASGVAHSLCDPSEQHLLREIERLTRKRLADATNPADVKWTPVAAPAANPAREPVREPRREARHAEGRPQQQAPAQRRRRRRRPASDRAA